MKKKALKIAGAITLSLAFAAAALEWNGYRPLDRKDGSNVLCEKDKACRALTEGEIRLARSVFRDTIDYTHIKIFNRPYYMISGKDGSASIVTPNGNLYFSTAYVYAEDFSKTDIVKKSNFIHEMAHVWQYQNSMSVRLSATIAFVKSNFNYATIYDYDDKIKFKEMNLEQQAHLIEDYFRTKTTAQEVGCNYLCGKARNELPALEKRLPPSLKPVR